MIELAAILAFISFFVLVSVGIAILFVFALGTGTRKGERLRELGQRLGLSSAGPRWIAGTREGVQCSVRFVTEGSGDNKSSWTYVEATIDPPLRLGLNLRAQHWLGAAFSDLLGAPDLRVGDAAFDEAFRLSALEKDEVPSLFDPQLRTHCLWAHRSFTRFWLTDDRVHASLRGHSVDETKIQTYLDGVVRIALDARRARLAMGPTAREQQVIDSWGQLAIATGYRFVPQTLALSGESGRHEFTVVPILGASGWSTRFRVTFDRPLGVALHVRREHALASLGRLFGMTDIEVGDPRFDDFFTIKGSDPDTIRHIFGEESLRTAILELFAAAKSFEIHDEHLDAEAMGLVADGAALDRSLKSVVAIAEGLRSRLAVPSGGAYR